jgi:hypothetical protein
MKVWVEGSKPDQTDPRGVRDGKDPREGYKPVSDDPDPRNVKTSQDPRVDSAVTVFATNIANYKPANGRSSKQGSEAYSRALEVLNQLQTFEQFEEFYTSYNKQTSNNFADAFSKIKDSDKDRLLTQWFGSSTTEYLKEVIYQTQTWVWTNDDKVQEVETRFNANAAQKKNTRWPGTLDTDLTMAEPG